MRRKGNALFSAIRIMRLVFSLVSQAGTDGQADDNGTNDDDEQNEMFHDCLMVE